VPHPTQLDPTSQNYVDRLHIINPCENLHPLSKFLLLSSDGFNIKRIWIVQTKNKQITSESSHKWGISWAEPTCALGRTFIPVL
jgi:hypothetical protein